MDHKKLVISVLVIIITIGLVWLGASMFLKYRSAETLKKDYEKISSYYDEFGFSEELKRELGEKEQETNSFYRKRKYVEAANKYTEIINLSLEKIKDVVSLKKEEAIKRGYVIKEAEGLYTLANNTWEEKNYIESAQYFLESYKKIVKIIDEFDKKSEELRPEITEKIAKEAITHLLSKDYEVSEILLLMDGSWSVATVIPLTFKTDDARIALQELDGKWRVVAGPGTYFSQEDFINIPEEVLNALNGGI